MAKVQLSTERVLESATKIADSEGLDAVTLTRVAQALGVSQPALYRHVDSFNALIRSLGLRGREILGRRLMTAAVGLSEEDAVRAMGQAWRKLVKDHPGLYAATDRYPCAGDVELEEQVDQVVATLAQALVGFDLDEDDQVHGARTLRSAFHGFSHLEAGDGHPLKQDLDGSFEQMVQLLCRGLRSMSI